MSISVHICMQINAMYNATKCMQHHELMQCHEHDLLCYTRCFNKYPASTVLPTCHAEVNQSHPAARQRTKYTCRTSAQSPHSAEAAHAAQAAQAAPRLWLHWPSRALKITCFHRFRLLGLDSLAICVVLCCLLWLPSLLGLDPLAICVILFCRL